MADQIFTLFVHYCPQVSIGVSSRLPKWGMGVQGLFGVWECINSSAEFDCKALTRVEVMVIGGLHKGLGLYINRCNSNKRDANR